MERAIALALESVRSGAGGPFGALVVREGEVIAEATNEVLAGNDPTAHAEILAIRRACQALGRFELAGCDLYCSCEPCPMCLGAIYWARPRRVYFAANATDAAAVGFDDFRIHREFQKRPADRRINLVQVMREQALEPLRAWREKPDKVQY